MARGKVLVVDDSDTDRTTLTTTLKSDGYVVVTASNAEEGRAQLEGQSPDLLLLDVIMPGTNGYQFCRTLRKNARYAKLPIILVTSKDQPTDREWGIRQGATDYLTKPYSASELLSIVHKHL